MNASLRILSCIVLAVTLVNCNENLPQKKVEPILIGLLVDKATAGGPPTINAANLYVRRLNEQGGILIKDQRYPVKLFIEDTKVNNDIAVEAARRLIYEHKVAAIVGPNISRTAFAASAVAESAKVLMISPGATSSQVDKSKEFVIRLACSNEAQGDLLAEFATIELGLKKAAVLYNVGNPSSRSVAESFQTQIIHYGGKIAVALHYTDEKLEFEKLVKKLVAQESDVILLPNATTHSAQQLKLIRESGYQGRILGSDNWGPLKIIDNPLFHQSFYIHHWHPDTAFKNELAAAFIKDYEENFQQKPTSMSALTYDAFDIVIRGLSKSVEEELPLHVAVKNIGLVEGVTGQVEMQADKKEKRPIIVGVSNNESFPYRSNTWVH